MSNAAAEMTHTAAEQAATILNEAKDKFGPLLDQSKDKFAPLLDQGMEKLAPFATEARTRGTALANEARHRGTEYAHQAAVAMAPALAAAKGAAKHRYEEYLPKVTDALEHLANNSNAQEAQYRSVAALKALRGDLQLSKSDRKKLHKESLAQIQALNDAATPKRKKKGVLLKLVLFAALGGVAYVVWKKFFAPQETAWQTHTSAATPAPSAPRQTVTFSESATKPAAESPAEPTPEPAAETPAEPASEAPEPAAPAAAEPEAAAVDADATVARASLEPKYGEGSYVGAEPPEGYIIKGNERSMKYHVPGAGGYERTIAEVWFNSEEAAEAAGFAKAQR